MQPNVLMYATGTCPFCERARELLVLKQVRYQEIRVDKKPERREEMMKKSGRRTVPQIFIGDVAIGGCDDLYALESEGRLDGLLAGAKA